MNQPTWVRQVIIGSHPHSDGTFDKANDFQLVQKSLVTVKLPQWVNQVGVRQVIIGSYPHGDGTFDKANDFQSVVVDGAWNMALATAKLHAGQVAYIVPAAKGEP